MRLRSLALLTFLAVLAFIVASSPGCGDCTPVTTSPQVTLRSDLDQSMVAVLAGSEAIGGTADVESVTVPRCSALYHATQYSPATCGQGVRSGERSLPVYELQCVGAYVGASHSIQHWNSRANASIGGSHPMYSVVHGAVSPGRLVAQADMILALGNLSRPQRMENGSSTTIVELGCGNGNLLYSMCPPLPSWHCAGTDYAIEMIRYGRAFMPWLDLRWGIGASYVRSGTADLVVSHGVVPYLDPQQLCHHAAEGLRLLKVGGIFVIWMVNRGRFSTQIDPGFWFGTFGGTAPPSAFPFCRGLSHFVEEVRILLEFPEAPIYTPRPENTWYGVRITRSSFPYVNDTFAEPPKILDWGDPEWRSAFRRYSSELHRFRRVLYTQKSARTGARYWTDHSGPPRPAQSGGKHEFVFQKVKRKEKVRRKSH